MEIRVLRVNNPALMNAFLSVPTLVYGGREIPPPSRCAEKFSPQNPTLEHVSFANFVAIEDGRPIGRISATVDRLNPREEEGFWGCFECSESPEAAEALINEAAGWLKNQGKTVMTGPASLNTNQTVGLLIKGFEYAPQNNIPYNPPYYQDLLEGGGLNKVHDLECYKWELPDKLPAEMDEAPTYPGLTIRSVNYNAPFQEARIIQKFHNTVMSGIWGHIPITFSEAMGFISALSASVPPDLFLMCEVDGRFAAMLLSIPGREKDGTWFLRHAIGGIMPEFRKRGLPIPILRESYKRCKKLGLTRGEASQVAESNVAVKKSVLNPIFGGEVIKLYRVYQCNLS
ncbi:MAG: hypothetical protein ACOY46_06800 [Bacillota bacterium]